VDLDNLIVHGKMLIEELRLRASEFNGKSSQYEELFWEAVGVETRVNMLINGDYTSLRAESTKTNSWGEGLFVHSPQQGKKVVTFYRELYAKVNT
jgi:hypothetical protein